MQWSVGLVLVYSCWSGYVYHTVFCFVFGKGHILFSFIALFISAENDNLIAEVSSSDPLAISLFGCLWWRGNCDIFYCSSTWSDKKVLSLMLWAVLLLLFWIFFVSAYKFILSYTHSGTKIVKVQTFQRNDWSFSIPNVDSWVTNQKIWYYL